MELVYRQESYEIVGAFFEVYNELGQGFLEDVCQEALEAELRSKRVPFNAEQKLEIRYKGKLLTKKYEPDFVVYSKVIVELKSVKALAPEHRAQVQNYLKASSFKLGLLANFSNPKELEYERIVR